MSIIRLYRFLFARKLFFRWNRLLYRCSLSGLGVLNYENGKVSGEERFLKDLLYRGRKEVIVDVGANVGNYSRKVLEINPAATVYAFEPHPKNFSRLISNIKDASFFAVNAGVGGNDNVMTLYDYADRDGSSHASLYKDVIEGIHKQKSVEHKVRVVTLDSFFSDKQIDRIDLLKIDTEGNELDVLNGAENLLKRKIINAIHFEFNEMNAVSRTFFRDFFRRLTDYDFYRLLPDGMLEIKDYSPIFCEIFAYQNIVAILKKDTPESLS